MRVRQIQGQTSAIVGVMNLAVMIIFISSIAYAAAISEIPWNVQNLKTLRSEGKPTVADFIWSTSYSPVKTMANDIGEFAWADLAGVGRLELLVTLDVNGRGFFNALLMPARIMS